MQNNAKLDDYDYLFKIILLGDTHVGKTSIVSQFVNKNYNKYQEPTIGVDFKVNCKTINDKKVKLYLWDTAGQEKFHSIIQSYYKNVGGGVVVYDVTNTQSYNNVIHWIEEIRKYIGSDSLGYLNVEGLLKAVGVQDSSYCRACFTGEYPIPVQLEMNKMQLEEIP